MSSADITITNNYWNMLRNLNDEVKLRLASMLTASVVEHKNMSVSEKVSITEAMVKNMLGLGKMIVHLMK